MGFSSNNDLLLTSNKNKTWQSDAVLWLEANDASTLVLNGTSVSRWKDKSGNGNDAVQSDTTIQPTFSSSPARVIFNKTTQKLSATIPATNGTMILATPNGTQAYGVSIPAGSYEIGSRGGLYMPDNAVVGQIVTRIGLSQKETDYAIARLKSQGGGGDYGSVTNFTQFWRNWSELTSFPLANTGSGTNFYGTWWGCSGLTSFPLIDTSKGTTFQSAWQGCSGLTSFPLIDTSRALTFQNSWTNCSGLTSFPLLNTAAATSFSLTWYGCSGLTDFPMLDTSKGVNFSNAWYGCSGLTSFPMINVKNSTNFSSTWRVCSNLAAFPANFFDGCLATNFINAFSATKLTQSSIDNILVSINSNNTSNGTFNQSGGSAPSSAGQSAITAMRSRGWTVAVTGGF